MGSKTPALGNDRVWRIPTKDSSILGTNLLNDRLRITIQFV